MKLLISVIHRDDTYPLTEALVGEGYAATVISTTGGFLREGNATLLTGVADEQVGEALGIIRANCRARTVRQPLAADGRERGTVYAYPYRSSGGGAVVFVVDVERFERF